MLEAIPVDESADLDTLDDFLASDRTPEDCMQLSELDGFLAGIGIGPAPVLPSTWLPMVWRSGEPAFSDLREAQTILGAIMCRYNEIIRLADAGPGSYQPIFVLNDDGSSDPSDWAVGFLQAMMLCPDGWVPLVSDPLAGALMVPIMQFASTTDMANLPLDEDERLPEDEMEKLLAQAGPMISLCVGAVRAFFQQQRRSPPRGRRGRSKRKRTVL